jgi:hypothetical protein
MKKHLFVIFAALFTVQSLAQNSNVTEKKVEVGVLTNVNYSFQEIKYKQPNFKMEGTYPELAFSGGIYVNFLKNIKRFGLELQVKYVAQRQGLKFGEVRPDGSFGLSDSKFYNQYNYLSFSPYGIIKLTKSSNILIGTDFNVLMSHKLYSVVASSRNPAKIQTSLSFKAVQKIKKFGVEIGYQRGLTPFDEIKFQPNTTDADVKFYNHSVSVGLRYSLY